MADVKGRSAGSAGRLRDRVSPAFGVTWLSPNESPSRRIARAAAGRLLSMDLYPVGRIKERALGDKVRVATGADCGTAARVFRMIICRRLASNAN